MTQSDTPEGLHPMQYAAKICEDRLAWPALKQNLELIAPCIDSIAKKWRRTPAKAYEWLDKALGVAQALRIPIDRNFFVEAKYNSLPKLDGQIPEYKRNDRAATEAEQNTPEFKELSNLARKKLRELAGMKDMNLVTHTKSELKAQAARLQK